MRKRSEDCTGGFWQCLLCCHGNATGLASKGWQRFASTVALSQHRSHYLSEQRESEKKETSFDKITNPRALLMGAAPHRCVLTGNIHEDHIYLWRRGIRIFCPNFFFCAADISMNSSELLCNRINFNPTTSRHATH